MSPSSFGRHVAVGNALATARARASHPRWDTAAAAVASIAGVLLSAFSVIAKPCAVKVLRDSSSSSFDASFDAQEAASASQASGVRRSPRASYLAHALYAMATSWAFISAAVVSTRDESAEASLAVNDFSNRSVQRDVGNARKSECKTPRPCITPLTARACSSSTFSRTSLSSFGSLGSCDSLAPTRSLAASESRVSPRRCPSPRRRPWRRSRLPSLAMSRASRLACFHRELTAVATFTAFISSPRASTMASSASTSRACARSPFSRTCSLDGPDGYEPLDDAPPSRRRRVPPVSGPIGPPSAPVSLRRPSRSARSRSDLTLVHPPSPVAAHRASPRIPPPRSTRVG
mmetsp:Transcript_12657/g.57118  ORF Transcript_12657/g.57118 Transcript_12657/m.57118 type:complete len:347 (+) Transcript_12657:2703-3743(+)